MIQIDQKYKPLKLIDFRIIDFLPNDKQLFTVFLFYQGVWKVKINGKKVPISSIYQVALNENGEIDIELYGIYGTIKKTKTVQAINMELNLPKYTYKNAISKGLDIMQLGGYEYQFKIDNLFKNKNIYIKRKLLTTPISDKKLQVENSFFKLNFKEILKTLSNGENKN